MKIIAAHNWLSLGIAILFGVCGTISMKLSHGLHRIKSAISVAFFYMISFIALTFAMKYIELSVVYAVWSGAGTVLVAIFGIFYFKESISFKKIFFLSLIVIGVIGMHLGEQIF